MDHEASNADGPAHRDFTAEWFARNKQRAAGLRAAVAAAVAAYSRSGGMGDAALAYARHGVPVFPLTVDKKPVPAQDRDEWGRSIPGTGSFKKATTYAPQIEAWWRGQEYLIGVPMGFPSGVCCIDVDTGEDHADGLTQWHKLLAQHGPIHTREHRSATGGPHLIFDFSSPIGCSSGKLPEGIEVKGQGGYIVVPPSRRKGRDYTVHCDIDPAPLPPWLRDLIWAGPRRSKASARTGTADPEEVADALAAIPNDRTSWDDWKAMGLRVYAALGDAGEEVFETWSKKSRLKHTDEGFDQAWREINASPPDRTGVGAIFKIARKHGWTPKLYECPPTYPAAPDDLDEARREVRAVIDRFWTRADAWDPEGEAPPPVEAVCIDTGLGKTEEAIASVADGGRQELVYTVDRHRLSDEIAGRFAAGGVTAAVFRGRGADDPDNPGQAMCLAPQRVALATKAHADINATCCRSKGRACPFITRCGYFRQQEAEPDVWVAAHDMLFHAVRAFGRPRAVIIDESMWDKGLRGIENEWTVPLDSLLKDPDGYDDDYRAYLRKRLGVALGKQTENGGVRAEHLAAAFKPSTCRTARRLEWALLPKLPLHPDLPEEEVAQWGTDHAALLDTIGHTRRVIQVWEAVEELLKDPSIRVSGRLSLLQRNGQRVVAWRGVTKVTKMFQVPTLMLDATLPALPVLQVYHPQAEIVADIKVALPPFVRVRQVLRSPTSSRKLEDAAHLDAIHRTVLRRWLECGRGSTLVICQLKVEAELNRRGLPGNVTVVHYNDIAGLDHFRDVRLCILVGRTAPGPRAMEALAAAMSGREPVAVTAARGAFVWYRRVEQGIRLRDGRGIKTWGDRHPDPFVEFIRWLVHEGELIQALGRPRGVNRTALTPLDIDLLFDTCLPITVDEAVLWEPPSLFYATAVEGVMLPSQSAMTRLWPALWANERAAGRTLAGGVPVLPGFEEVAFQLKGPKQKRRIAHFDRTVIASPEAWLRARLGPLA